MFFFFLKICSTAKLATACDKMFLQRFIFFERLCFTMVLRFFLGEKHVEVCWFMCSKLYNPSLVDGNTKDEIEHTRGGMVLLDFCF